MQWYRKYYQTGDKFPHILNASKYSLTILVVVSSFTSKISGIQVSSFYFILRILATIFSYLYDLLIDWGLLKSYSKNIFLR